MAEIKIERKQHGSFVPWLLALALLVLVIWGVTRVMEHRHATTPDLRPGAAAADTIRDNTPPRLRQYAALSALRDAA